jgi:hypothetical protein
LIVVGEREEGQDDAAAPNARHAATVMRDGRAVVLPGLGHGMAFVRADLVVPTVEAFLDEVAP